MEKESVGEERSGKSMFIRIATEDDLDAMLRIYAPYVSETTYSFEYDVPSFDTFRARFCSHIVQCPWLVCEEDGEVLGYAYAGRAFERAAYAWAAEISIYLDPRCHRRGIGRMLYERIEAILTEQGYRVVYAVITSENEGSIAFHKSRGVQRRALFEKVGYKFGRWCDVLWFEKRLCADGNPSDCPRPWCDFSET